MSKLISIALLSWSALQLDAPIGSYFGPTARTMVLNVRTALSFETVMPALYRRDRR
jgi:hypothetical protein